MVGVPAAREVARQRARGASRGAPGGHPLRFWDTSAIVPTIFEEPSSERMRALSIDDPVLAVWWITLVECHSAVARRERRGELEPRESTRALESLAGFQSTWNEVPPSESVRDTARRIVRVHDLRTADAFQLAAARTVCEDHPETLPFVTLDDRLALAASREGFPVLGLD